jgi:MFS family permease
LQQQLDNNNDISIVARLCLLLTMPLSGMAQSGLAPILPKLSEHFAAEPNADTMVRLMVSGLSFAMIAGALAGAMVGDRLGQRRVLLWSLVVYGIAGTAGYYLDNLYLIIVSRLLLGVVNAVAGIMVATIFTTRIGPATREKWLGFMMVAGTVGSILLFRVVGAVAESDWRNVFAIHALAWPIALLITLTLPAAASLPRTVTAVTDTPRQAAPGGFPIGMALVGIACGMVITGYQLFLPFHFRSNGYGAPELIANAIIVTAIAGAVVSFGYGWVRARLSAVPVFMLGFAIVAVGLAVVALSKQYPLALVGLAVVGGGVGLIGPNLFSASAAAAPPERRARSIGFARAGMYAGPLASQLPLEPLVKSAGAGAAILAICGLAAIMVVVVALSRALFVPAGDEPRAAGH